MLQAAVENSYDIISLLQEDGTILFQSPSFSRVLGYEVQDVIGTSAFDLVHPDDLPLLLQDVSAALEQGRGEVSAYRYRTQSGEWRWIKSTGAVLTHDFPRTVVVNSRDITEQIQAKEAEEKVCREVLTIWDSMTDAFVAVDKQWNFSYANAQGEDLLQRKREDLLGKNLWEEFPEAVDSTFYHQYHKAMDQQVAVSFEEHFAPLNTWFEVHAHPSDVGLSIYFRTINERKQAEADLRESEARLLQAQEIAHVGYLEMDVSTQVPRWSDETYRILGLEPQSFRPEHQQLLEYVHPDDLKKASQAVQELLQQGQPFDIEHRIVRPSGEVRWVQARAEVIRSQEGRPIRYVGTLQDITQRKHAEDALRESKANLARAQQIAHLGSWELDLLNTNDVLANPLRWSDQNFRILGYEPGQIEVSNENFLRCVHPDDRERVLAAMAQALSGEKPYNVEHRIIWPDGTERIIHGQAEVIRDEVSGSPIKVIGTGQDITERKRAEETQARLAAIVESSNDAIMSMDNEGFITSWNAAAGRLFGYAADEAIGASVSVCWPADRAAEAMGLFSRIRQGERVQQFETERLHKDGHRIPVSLTISPMAYGSDITGFSAVVRDITERKHAEEALRRSQELYRTLAHNFPNGGVYLLDREGRFLLAEGRGLAKIGLSTEAVEGKGLHEIWDGEVYPEIDTVFEKALGGEEATLEVEVRGRFRLIRAVPVRDTNNEITHVLSITQDITEQKHAEQAQARLAAIVESSTDAIMGKDLNGVVTSWNHAAEQLYGYTAAEITGQSINLLVPEDRLHEEDDFLEKHKQGEAVKHFETVRLRKDGRHITVSLSSSPLIDARGGIIGASQIIRDITERKQGEAAQVRLATIVESSEDAIISKTLEGVITTWNRGAEQIYGYTAQEAIGRHMSMLLPPDRPLEEDGILERLRAGEHVHHFETKRVCKDGQVIDVSVSSSPVIDTAGEVVGASSIARDITALIQAQSALHRVNEELEERVTQRTADLDATNKELQAQVAERQMAVGALREIVDLLERAKQEAEEAKDQAVGARLEAEKANNAKSEFLSRMSHELRTPLNAILGFGQILEMRDLPPKESQGVEQILKAGRHLLQLINEVLDISRIEAGNVSLSIEPTEVSALLNEVSELVQPLAAQRNVTLLSETDAETLLPGGPYVMADRQRLLQVLLNLLSNAIKYNRESGSVTLSLQQVNLGPGGQQGSPRGQQGSWRIAVRDTGPGIAPEDQERLFLPFERLGAKHTTTEGTGIGLALVKRLVQLMHGTIGVESQPGQGSTFWVELPSAHNPLKQLEYADPEGALESPPSLNKPTTLLSIEDNPANLHLMKVIVAQMPQVRLLTAIQGRMGIEMARLHRPDVILLDMHLPDIQGDEVLRQLQEDPATSSIPIIIVSADVTPGQINRLLGSGARRYITKPLDIKHFRATLGEVLKEND